MPNYVDHSKVIELLRQDQEAERERRDTVREVERFLDDDDGQWEGRVKDQMTTAGRPRYTFDRCNDMVDDITGEILQADFNISVKPAGGEATKDLAKTYDGLIRNIENLSGATDIFNDAARKMVRSGMGGWRIAQRWGDNNTFDQDLYIDPISDFVDRVWFDRTSVRQTREDARHCWVLENMDLDTYKERWPKGSGQSVSSETIDDTNLDMVVVGELIYKVKVKTRIVEMTNGAVYVDNDDYQKIKDELAAKGVAEKRERFRMLDAVKTRLFDGGGWLNEPQDTVFEYLPIVPTYGNFGVSNKKVVYWGVVTKKMDAQRVFNYAESRKVEEGALAPLEKIVFTPEQVEGYEDEWSKLNTSADPGLPYNHMDGQPPPYKLGGAQINPGLESVSQSAQLNLQSTAGLEQLDGRPLGLQSGTAVELKQNKGDTRNFKYTVSQQKAICHTGLILMRAAPKVYDTKRLVRILNEDDSFDLVTLNDEEFDEESEKMVPVNDLSKGLYDVTCDVGPAFKNRQTETTQAFLEVAEIDPTIITDGGDILFSNFNSPGMDQLAERRRAKLVSAGAIPEEQLTDEEKEQLANAPEPEPDPVAVALEREAEAKDDEIQIKAIEAARKDRELEAKIENDKRDDDRASMEEAFKNIATMAKALNEQAAAYKALAEAKGIEGIDVPGVDALLTKQAGVITETQAEQP